MGLFDLFKKKPKKLSGKEILRNRLEEIFSTEYYNYEVRKDIPIFEIKYVDVEINYSYGLYSNGRPVAFIMVINNRNDYRKKEYRIAKEIAENQNITYLNFYSHLPNEPEYISERLRNNI